MMLLANNISLWLNNFSIVAHIVVFFLEVLYDSPVYTVLLIILDQVIITIIILHLITTFIMVLLIFVVEMLLL